MSRALQFHPTKSKLWIFAGYHELNWNDNMPAARIMMQRGLRLNMHSPELWIEYCRIELLYIIKLSARHKILEIHEVKDNKNNHSLIQNKYTDEIIQDKGIDEETQNEGVIETIKDDYIVLSDIVSKEYGKVHSIAPTDTRPNQSGNLVLDFQNNPVINGEIASIIIKTSTQHIQNNIELLESFYDMIESFDNLKCKCRLLDQIISLIREIPTTDLVEVTLLTLPLRKFLKNVSDRSFPNVLKSSLLKFEALTIQIDCSIMSYEKFCFSLNLFLDKEGLDNNLYTIISCFLHTILKKLEISGRLSSKLKKLQKRFSFVSESNVDSRSNLNSETQI
ncbi:hypothetical protein PMAC_000187 [Pneumocystis sp. 'macacae']|nr:hypothetical protein PMAC_000187 [Pneumocystis sp. 'macacae']